MYMELSSHPRILEKNKIKPVAVPVGFKVVNGYRRIGKRHAVFRLQSALKGGASALASALAGRQGPWAGRRASGTRPEKEISPSHLLSISDG